MRLGTAMEVQNLSVGLGLVFPPLSEDSSGSGPAVSGGHRASSDQAELGAFSLRGFHLLTCGPIWSEMLPACLRKVIASRSALC